MIRGDAVGLIATFDVDGEREITYWVDPERWGEGIASHAISLMLQTDSIHPLWARTAIGNSRSARVLARHGFTAVGEEVSFAPGLGRDEREVIHRLDARD